MARVPREPPGFFSAPRCWSSADARTNYTAMEAEILARTYLGARRRRQKRRFVGNIAPP